jgi:predicted molibdopterin-dependent oxidoreductase YjgC
MSPEPMSTEPTSTFTVTFAGRALPARDGQSVAAALTAAGVRSWRTTRREGRPRGLFCGIGVCFDCLLSIDGRPAQRACLVPVRDGMVLGDTSDG